MKEGMTSDSIEYNDLLIKSIIIQRGNSAWVIQFKWKSNRINDNIYNRNLSD